MEDANIMQRVQALIDEEHTLRSELSTGARDAEAERRRLNEVEESLDQCWDLLRQRRARRDAGQDPDQAEPRSAQQVESYLQ